jgi:predicted alpha/beta-hydrolase family hydrolase
MKKKKLTIALRAGESISAVLTMPADRDRAETVGVITAHGAGNDMENPLLVAFTEGLARAGYPALRFNFPYKEKGLKTPDRPEKLEEAWVKACRYFRENSGVNLTRIIAAGKSMGGRIASQMAAAGTLPVDGLIFLGYPLHPAGDLSKIRDAHLYRIAVPLLLFAGTRDSLCNLEALQAVLAKLPARWRLEIIEGGDHSFHVPKSMGVGESEIFDRIVKTARQWLEDTYP